MPLFLGQDKKKAAQVGGEDSSGEEEAAADRANEELPEDVVQAAEEQQAQQPVQRTHRTLEEDLDVDDDIIHTSDEEDPPDTEEERLEKLKNFEIWYQEHERALYEEEDDEVAFQMMTELNTIRNVAEVDQEAAFNMLVELNTMRNLKLTTGKGFGGSEHSDDDDHRDDGRRRRGGRREADTASEGHQSDFAEGDVSGHDGARRGHGQEAMPASDAVQPPGHAPPIVPPRRQGSLNKNSLSTGIPGPGPELYPPPPRRKGNHLPLPPRRTGSSSHVSVGDRSMSEASGTGSESDCGSSEEEMPPPVPQRQRSLLGKQKMERQQLVNQFGAPPAAQRQSARDIYNLAFQEVVQQQHAPPVAPPPPAAPASGTSVQSSVGSLPDIGNDFQNAAYPAAARAFFERKTQSAPDLNRTPSNTSSASNRSNRSQEGQSPPPAAARKFFESQSQSARDLNPQQGQFPSPSAARSFFESRQNQSARDLTVTGRDMSAPSSSAGSFHTPQQAPSSTGSWQTARSHQSVQPSLGDSSPPPPMLIKASSDGGVYIASQVARGGPPGPHEAHVASTLPGARVFAPTAFNTDSDADGSLADPGGHGGTGHNDRRSSDSSFSSNNTAQDLTIVPRHYVASAAVDEQDVQQGSFSIPIPEECEMSISSSSSSLQTSVAEKSEISKRAAAKLGTPSPEKPAPSGVMAGWGKDTFQVTVGESLEAGFDFAADQADELGVQAGEGLQILSLTDDDRWLRARSMKSGKIGLVPASHVRRKH